MRCWVGGGVASAAIVIVTMVLTVSIFSPPFSFSPSSSLPRRHPSNSHTSPLPYSPILPSLSQQLKHYRQEWEACRLVWHCVVVFRFAVDISALFIRVMSYMSCDEEASRFRDGILQGAHMAKHHPPCSCSEFIPKHSSLPLPSFPPQTSKSVSL